MIEGIRQNLTLVDPSARKSKTDSASSASSATASDASSLSQGLVAELVEISTTAGRQSSPPIDRAKVDAIRTAIKNNAYPVDFDELAKRMVEQFVSGSGSE
jgi:flagellar biosynthesis anti-sigma factor FlgM